MIKIIIWLSDFKLYKTKPIRLVFMMYFVDYYVSILIINRYMFDWPVACQITHLGIKAIL